MANLADLVIRDITNGNLPRFLYKYRGIDDTLERIIQSNSLWFANPFSFNDPFDCQIQINAHNTVQEITDYISRNSPGIKTSELNYIVGSIIADPNYWPKTLKTIVRNNINTRGICCFSSHNESVLMWSHYANCHRGLALKFDVKKDPNFFVHPIKVTYSDDYPVYNHIRDHKDIVKLLIQNKSKAWEYEEEIRVLKSKVGVQNFDKSALVEVTFGCNCEPAEMVRIRALFLKRGYNDTLFKKAVLSKNKYKLEFENL